MKVTIKKGLLQGETTAPMSKSLAHRLIIGAALSDGESRINNITLNEDISATLDCISSLGAKYLFVGTSLIINGIKTNAAEAFPCRESGSTLRFMIPLALTVSDNAVFKGTQRLISRGIGVYEELFKDKGISFEFSTDSITAHGRLTSGCYDIRGDVSSQFITGMLFALPLLNGDSTLKILPPIESKSYIDITLSVLRSFGIEIHESSPAVYKIKGSQRYKAGSFTAEGDWSNAAFLHAFNTLGSDISILGLDHNSPQGDKVCLEYLEALKNDSPTLDLSDFPDLAPILFAVAAKLNGAAFTGTKRLAIKESDRAAAMAQELLKFGVHVTVNENSAVIPNCELHRPAEELDGHNDHRIVMALSVLGSCFGVTIDGAEAVNKSYPDFFKTVKKLGLEVDYGS